MTHADTLARGFLFLIDKPAGLTSHDVVEHVRRSAGLARIGHSGTLDPMATGLLLLCAGPAARLQGFFTRMDKTYEGTIALGRATTTYDREGETVGEERDASKVTIEQLEAAAAEFRGEFFQSPPPYSAKKHGGRKFYEMARKGESGADRAQESPRLRSRFRRLESGKVGVLDSLLVRHLRPIDRERPRGETRLRRAPGDACAARRSAPFEFRTQSS